MALRSAWREWRGGGRVTGEGRGLGTERENKGTGIAEKKERQGESRESGEEGEEL